MDLLSLLLLLVVGGFAGWAATRVLKTGKQDSVIVYVVIGVIGAVVGRFVIDFLGFAVVGDGVVVNFIVALIGSVILVGLSKFIAGKAS